MEARRDLTNHARSLALGTVDSAAPIPVATDAFSDDALNRSSSGPTPLATRDDARRRRARRGRHHHHRRRRHRRRRREHRRRGDASRSPRGVPDATDPSPIEFGAGQVVPRQLAESSAAAAVGVLDSERNSSCARNGWCDIPADLASAWCVVPQPEGDAALVIWRLRVSADAEGSARPRVASIPIRASRWIVLDATWGRLLHPRLRVSSPRPDVLRDGLLGVERDVDVRLRGGDAAELVARQTRGPGTAECAAAGPPVTEQQDPSPFPPRCRATRAGLGRAYADEPGFARDGLMFLAKDGNYELGTRPWRAWKDPRCSAHFLDENPGLSDSGRQRVVLALRAETGDVVTGDAHPRAWRASRAIASADGGGGDGYEAAS